MTDTEKPTEPQLDKMTYKFQGKGDHPNSDEVTAVPNLTSAEENPYEKAISDAESKPTSSRTTSTSTKSSK